jgi:hypothetical protein
VQVRVEDAQVGLSHVRRLPGQAVEEDTAERVDVDPAVERPALDLLGSAVVDGAEKEARLRELSRGRPLGEAEVAQVRMVVRLGEEDIRGLNVAVDESRPVRSVESAADLLREPQRLRK